MSRLKATRPLPSPAALQPPCPAAWCLALILLPACCTTPPVPDFSTPEATLTTFQDAFNADMPKLEYECFALEFKKNRGNFDLEQYIIARDRALDDNPLISAFMSLKDLADSIDSLDMGSDGRTALMTLSVLGEEFRIRFRCETVFAIEVKSDKRRRTDLMPPFDESVQVSPRKDAFGIVFEGVQRSWIRKLPDLRKLTVEEQWKFADIDFLEGGAPPEPQL
jgi:hypothetical protein